MMNKFETVEKPHMSSVPQMPGLGPSSRPKPLLGMRPATKGLSQRSQLKHRKSIEELRERAIELGAGASKAIEASSVKAAAWVRYKCQFGCDGFGECFTCPPHSPTPDETQEILSSFKKAILIHCASGSRRDISKIVLQIEKEAFLAGYYKALSMGAGPCRLCVACNLKGECRHRDKARPSMEACGIDVFSTARKNGFTIDTLDSARCRADYFGLVLID
jgi:predicted metal-binding protein